MSRLEGAYEQIDRRLGDLHADLDGLRAEFGGLRAEFGGLRAEFGGLRAEFGGLRHDMERRFLWFTGVVVGTWITTIMTILFHRV